MRTNEQSTLPHRHEEGTRFTLPILRRPVQPLFHPLRHTVEREESKNLEVQRKPQYRR